MSQRAATTARKTNTRMWAEKKTFGGGSGAAAASGGVSSGSDLTRDKMKANVAVPANPGFVSVIVPAGGTAKIPFGNIVEPSLSNHITLSGNAVGVTEDALYYVGVSVKLYVPNFTGVSLVEIDIYKDLATYQNIIYDWTPNGQEIEKRFHAADYVRVDDTSTLEARFINTGVAPVTFNILDAYIDVGFGPLR